MLFKLETNTDWKRKTSGNKGCSQCGLTSGTRDFFARSGVFVGGRKRNTLSHTGHTPSR